MAIPFQTWDTSVVECCTKENIELYVCSRVEIGEERNTSIHILCMHALTSQMSINSRVRDSHIFRKRFAGEM